MATIQTAIQLVDGLSPAMRSIQSSVDNATTAFRSLDAEVQKGVDPAHIVKGTREIDALTGKMENVEKTTQRAGDVQEKHNRALKGGTGDAAGLVNAIRSVATAVSGLVPAMRSIQTSLEKATTASQTLGTEVRKGFDPAHIARAAQEIDALKTKIETVEKTTQRSGDAQEKFNRSLKNGSTEASGLMNAIKGIAAAALGMASLKVGIKATDDYTNQTARLALVNDGLQTQEQLQNNIYQAAQRARAPYGEMVSNVAKLNLLAKDAFKSNKEATRFSELMSKSFKISGASTQEQSSGTYQLTQAMAAGKLQGDEFRSIMENAPMLAQAIAKFTGKSMGELKEMSAEGTITADIIKGALFAAGDDIEKKFATMPMTFADVWTRIKNAATMQMSGLMQEVNAYLNSVDGAQAVQGIVTGMAALGSVVEGVVHGVMTVSGFVINNWPMIAPVVWGVVGAFAAFNLAAGITSAIMAAQAGFAAIMAARKMMLAGATFAETAAQYGLNAALYACPIVWIIVAIIALIVIFYAAVAAVNHFAGTSISATGMIVGAFATMAAIIWNTLLAAFELILAAVNHLINPFIAVANFLGNVFHAPVSSVIYLFQSMADNILMVLERIAGAMDILFGSKMADSVKSWRAGLKTMADDAVKAYAGDERYQKVANELNLSTSSIGLARWDYNDAYKSGYNVGQGIESKFDFSQLVDPKVGMLGDKNSTNLADMTANTAAMKDSMKVNAEDLKYLRDIAEKEAINRFTTAEVRVEMTNHNTIAAEMDIDGVISALADGVNEAMASCAEGVSRA